MKFLRTISKVRPFIKTLGGLKQVMKKGSGVVMPKLSRMNINNTPSVSKIGGKITGVKKQTQTLKPLKFLL
jgi:hypothetical protein